MKKFSFTFLFLAFASLAYSQAVVEEDQLEDTYSRNSISAIVISHSDNIDGAVSQGIQNIDFGGKFDINNLKTTTIHINSDRSKNIDSLIDLKINELNIGKEILSYWLQRQPDGTMSDLLMQERSKYNATDADVMKSQAAKVSTLADMGDQMIKNSYIMVFDAKSLTQDRSSDGTVSYSAQMNAYAYQINFTSDMLNDIYQNMWIASTDDNPTKEAKNQKFENMMIPMNRVALVNATGIGETGSAAVTDAYEDLLRKLENKISNWQVKVSIFTVKPITAKIGKKEGIKNGSRFKVFKYTEDKDGNLCMVKKGFVRATTVADNEGEATGESSTSRFYQIAGGKLREGMLMTQANDLKMGVSLGGQLGGLSLAYVRIDYLAKMQNSGISHYGLINIGGDLAILSFEEYGNIYEVEKPYMYYNVSIGYGIGIPLTRLFELQPFAAIGADYLAVGELYDDSKMSEFMGYFADAGLKFSWQPVYPVQIFAQADYSLLLPFKTGLVYNYFDSKSKVLGLGDKRFGLGLSVGVRYAF